MQYLQGKYFSIADPKNINTVVYEVKRTKRSKPKFIIERLDFIEKIVGNKKRRVFFVDEPKKMGNQLLFLSFEQEKVTINQGVLKNNEIKFTKKPIPLSFDTIYKSTEKDEYKEFNYTPNPKRQILIIDPETGDQVKPTLYYDNDTNEIKGKCKLKQNKSYFTFEVGPKI